MNTPSSPPQKPHQLQHHPSPTFSTTSSTVSTSFRSSERGILLRTISEKSHTLSNCQTTLLSPLEAMAEQLTAQKTIIHEALKHNKDEHLELLKEQEEMKAGMGVSIKTFKDQVSAQVAVNMQTNAMAFSKTHPRVHFKDLTFRRRRAS